MHSKTRKNLLSKVKGYRGDRSKKLRAARVAFLKAGVHAYTDRKKKKRNFRRLWQLRINAAARENGTTYSKLIHMLKTANIGLDRKILSEMAQKHPKVFEAILKTAQK